MKSGAFEPLQARDDLLWSVTSPSLMSGEQVAPVAATAAAAAAADIDVDVLAAFLAARPAHRVGRYFEHLVHFWLVHVRRVDVVGAGVQLRDGKRTIGELDFLYRDEADQLVHCEAAVKFFLHHPRANGSDYPGPNASDDFERKTSKLFDHQLRASHGYVPDVERREAFVKGMIFYHLGDDRPRDEPQRLAADHLCGMWLWASELDRLAARDEVVGATVRKPLWLAPDINADLVAAGQLADRLRVHFASGRAHPVMVTLRDPHSLVEVERLFVVADSWPGPP